MTYSTILAIDTAMDNCSVALLHDEKRYEYSQYAPREHQQRLLPMIEQVLHKANCRLAACDVIAVSQGPGSFTGLRVAFATAQALAFANHCRVICVSTLAVLAQQAYREHGQTEVLVALNARMSTCYWGCYRCDSAGLMQTVSPDALNLPEKINPPIADDWWGVGDASLSYPELKARLAPRVTWSDKPMASLAKDVLSLALDKASKRQTVAAEAAIPVYLRENVVQQSPAVVHATDKPDE